MALSKITTKGILDGTIATADLVDNAVNSAKIGVDVIVADDVANNVLQLHKYRWCSDRTQRLLMQLRWVLDTILQKMVL